MGGSSEVLSRERVRMILNHQEADFVPVDLGATVFTGIHRNAYLELRRYIGLPPTEPVIVNHMEQIVLVDGDLLAALGVKLEFMPFWGYAAPLRQPAIQSDDVEEYYLDEWGTKFAMPRCGGLYFDPVGFPLANAGLEDLRTYAWPKTPAGALYSQLAKVATARDDSDRAVIGYGPIGAGLFEQAWWMRGLERFLMDLVEDRVFAETLLDRILEVKLSFAELLFDAIGPHVDIVCLGDDWAGQCGPLMWPRLVREV